MSCVKSAWLGLGLLVVLGGCDKISSEKAAASASATGTAAPSTAATATASTGAGTGAGAGAGAGTGAGTGTGIAGGTTLVGGDKKGIATIDGGTAIYKDGKRVEFDGGALNLQNQGKQAGITTTDAGTTLKGASGKTLTIPPIPGH